MTLEREHDCPHCDAGTFYQAASTEIELGRKVKWRCIGCDYGFVRVGEDIDTASA